MRSVLKTLQRELRGRFGRLPVWPPGSSVALGDVGRFDAHGWVKITTLADLGIPAFIDDPGTPADIDLTSEKGVSLSQSSSAQAVAGDARLKVTFSASGSFVLKANAVASTRLTRLDELERLILSTPAWDRSWSVVTEVSAAGGPSCVLVAGDSSAEAVLAVGAGPVLPVGLGLNMSFVTKQGMAAAWITDEPTPVMMRAHYLRSSLTGATRLADRGGTEATQAQESRLAEVYEPEDVQALP